jgi:hypothetical protein
MVARARSSPVRPGCNEVGSFDMPLWPEAP